MTALGVQRAGAIRTHPPLLLCAAMTGSPRREGRRFSSSTHEMRQPDAANRLERRSVGGGLFESRRRSPRRDGGWGTPGYRTRLPPPRRINAAVVGVRVGNCYRRAETSSRDKPQPTETPFASPRARCPRPQAGEKLEAPVPDACPPKPRRQTFSPPKRGNGLLTTASHPSQRRVSTAGELRHWHSPLV